MMMMMIVIDDTCNVFANDRTFNLYDEYDEYDEDDEDDDEDDDEYTSSSLHIKDIGTSNVKHVIRP